MNGIEALHGFGAQGGIKTEKGGAALGKEDFLNLLVTQLKNQDPLNPSDPTEFTAQLAQYSSLEQLYNLNDRMAAFESVQSGFERLSALSLIGKNVVAESGAFRFDGEPVELGCRFPQDIERATVYVKNEAGQVVDEVALTAPSAGEEFFAWDGGGGELPAGNYHLEVIGTREDGSQVAGICLVGSRVTGVNFQESENTLLTTNGPVSAVDVTRVNNLTSGGQG
jgi:flagellar basal-body rod modification protein FlgD